MFHRIVKYSNGLGYKVRDGEEDVIRFTDHEIFINKNRKDEYRCYALLHELGHDHVRREICTDGETGIFSLFPGYSFAKKTKRFQVSQAEEEVYAWRAAEGIAYDKGFLMIKKHFDQFKAQCLASYFAQFGN
jgi:hypothetical protein